MAETKKTQKDACPKTSDDAPVMPLQMARQGQDVKLAKIRGGREMQHRLAEMGLTPGVKFKIINQGHPGPFIILLKDTRLVLGRGMTHQIFITT